MGAINVVAGAGLLLLAAACATPRYEPTAGVTKLTSPTRQVTVGPFEDQRSDKVPGQPDRIGDAWGGTGAAKWVVPFFVPVPITQPWQQQWTDALVGALRARGVSTTVVVPETAAGLADSLLLMGVVHEYSVSKLPFSPAKAHVKATVRIYDAANKALILERTVEGRHEQMMGLDNDVMAMNGAVQKAVEQFTMDPDVVAQLAKPQNRL